MAEIAATLGVTESRVSQLRAEALVLLRDALNNALDPDLVPEAARPGGAAARRREAYFAAVAARHAAGVRALRPRPRGRQRQRLTLAARRGHTPEEIAAESNFCADPLRRSAPGRSDRCTEPTDGLHPTHPPGRNPS